MKSNQVDNYLPSITIATCTSIEETDEVAIEIATSLVGLANSRIVIFSSVVGIESKHNVFFVPDGTKLSKLRNLSQAVNSDFVCVCDPDLYVRSDTTREVVSQAIETARGVSEVVAFGIVDCRDNGTLLSRVIAIDKWFSHCVLRPLLWRYGLGITIPGQFLVLSTSLLQRLDPAIDSYLDDLYLGWIARSTGVRVLRVPLVVGEEESRSTCASLFTQRLRWMRGFFSLVRHFSGNPKALGFLGIHFIAYHGFPILWLICISSLFVSLPEFAVALLVASALLISRLSKQSLVASATFGVLFPLLHCFATLLWWIPFSRRRLNQR
jgi:cellulose synthase/poly-beta-1,6-N-acetylglucosamine synthase-like glycosyltransferase